MNLPLIAWRNLRQRGLASALTTLNIALGVCLVVAILIIYGVTRDRFRQTATGYDLIVGAKGSPLQLVLNTVYLLSQPIENIPYSYYQELSRNAAVEAAIPYALGDSYRGFRLVGTTPELLDRFEVAPGRRYRFAAGHNFRGDFDAVAGARAAAQGALGVGQSFVATHGVSAIGPRHARNPFHVVGVLAPTGTPSDRAIFVNLKGFYRMEGHEPHRISLAATAGETAAPLPAEPARSGRHHPDAGHAGGRREITAVLLRLKGPALVPRLQVAINKGPVAQAVIPAEQIFWLFDTVVGNIEQLLLLLASIIVVVAGVSILVSIYNSMAERRREIAILRALGARRTQIMAVVLLESSVICFLGGAAGLILGHALVAALGPIIAARTGILISPLTARLDELAILPALVILAVLVGTIPAITAYRTDVGRNLAPIG